FCVRGRNGMKLRAYIGLLAVASLLASEADDKKLAEIKAKHDLGEKVTLEEQDLWSTSVERQNQENSAKRNADYARQHPARESTGKADKKLNPKMRFVDGAQGGQTAAMISDPAARYWSTVACASEGS